MQPGRNQEANRLEDRLITRTKELPVKPLNVSADRVNALFLEFLSQVTWSAEFQPDSLSVISVENTDSNSELTLKNHRSNQVWICFSVLWGASWVGSAVWSCSACLGLVWQVGRQVSDHDAPGWCSFSFFFFLPEQEPCFFVVVALLAWKKAKIYVLATTICDQI